MDSNDHKPSGKRPVNVLAVAGWRLVVLPDNPVVPGG